jgi:hypothetical protein
MWSARISRNHLDLTIECTQNIVEDSSNVGDVKIEQRHHARIGTLDPVKNLASVSDMAHQPALVGTDERGRTKESTGPKPNGGHRY